MTEDAVDVLERHFDDVRVGVAGDMTAIDFVIDRDAPAFIERQIAASSLVLGTEGDPVDFTLRFPTVDSSVHTHGGILDALEMAALSTDIPATGRTERGLRTITGVTRVVVNPHLDAVAGGVVRTLPDDADAAAEGIVTMVETYFSELLGEANHG